MLVIAMLSMAASSVSTADPLVVATSTGALQGILHGAVKEWRGIPYAAPPLGALRWRPPASATPWSGIRDATTFAPPCVQLDSDTTTTGTEDCLYLNVFAPDTAGAGANLAVMVHLHGGGNAFGAPYQDASAFVSRGVVVVTLAYRLGALGFVGHPLLSIEGGGASGEYGVLDQIAALRWVHENIAVFGGDPGNVTLFGLSAGSFDTVALMASPLSRPLIRKAAVQGEAYWAATGVFATIADAEQIGSFVASSVGCANAPDVVACLRGVPADALVIAAGFLDVDPWVGGQVLPRSPLDLVTANGGVPLLIGFDREEQAVFAWPFLAEPFRSENWVHTTDLLASPRFGAAARALYPPNHYDSLKWAYVTMETDMVRGCPTRRLANVNAASAPTYRWLYTHVFQNDPFLAQFRSSHTFEEFFIWSNFALFGSGYQPTAAEQVLAQRMTDYWTNFAKTGDPNGPGLPPWPTYDGAHERMLVLDDTIGAVTSYHASECAFFDGIAVAPFSFAPLGHGRKLGLFDFLP